MVNPHHLQERNGSFHSDSLPMFGQLGREQIAEAESLFHRASFSANGFPQLLDHSAADAGASRESNGSAYLPAKADSYSQIVPGTYTPDSQWQGHLGDPNTQFRGFRGFDSRGTPNGTYFRQNPQYSNTHTPPNYDRYQFRPDHAISNGNNIAMIERKLVGVQQQQIQLHNRQYVNHQQFPAQHMHLIPTSNMAPNNVHPVYYDMSNAVGVLQNYPAQLSNVMHMAPTGPSNQIEPRSPFLNEFKMHHPKGSRKYSLKDIYGYIAEFSGDQCGSRFIQNEIEKANSEEKKRVFSEIYPEAEQLMKDVFGNYVIQKFFDFGDQTQKRALANQMKGRILELTISTYGCRVVQKVNLDCALSSCRC
jgi:mRNA-binding protein PUF3